MASRPLGPPSLRFLRAPSWLPPQPVTTTGARGLIASACLLQDAYPGHIPGVHRTPSSRGVSFHCLGAHPQGRVLTASPLSVKVFCPIVCRPQLWTPRDAQIVPSRPATPGRGPPSCGPRQPTTSRASAHHPQRRAPAVQTVQAITMVLPRRRTAKDPDGSPIRDG